MKKSLHENAAAVSNRIHTWEDDCAFHGIIIPAAAWWDTFNRMVREIAAKCGVSRRRAKWEVQRYL